MIGSNYIKSMDYPEYETEMPTTNDILNGGATPGVFSSTYQATPEIPTTTTEGFFTEQLTSTTPSTTESIISTATDYITGQFNSTEGVLDVNPAFGSEWGWIEIGLGVGVGAVVVGTLGASAYFFYGWFSRRSLRIQQEGAARLSIV